jgi:hypothetical protein
MGVERVTFLRLTVKRGAQALMLDQACDSYRRGEMTLSFRMGIELYQAVLKEIESLY